MSNPSKAFMKGDGPSHRRPCIFHPDFSRIEHEDGSVDMRCIRGDCIETISEAEFLRLRSRRRNDPLLFVDRQRG